MNKNSRNRKVTKKGQLKYKISNEKVVITIYCSYLRLLSKMPLETIYSFVRRRRKSNEKTKRSRKVRCGSYVHRAQKKEKQSICETLK